jgi:hypothetical protein
VPASAPPAGPLGGSEPGKVIAVLTHDVARPSAANAHTGTVVLLPYVAAVIPEGATLEMLAYAPTWRLPLEIETATLVQLVAWPAALTMQTGMVEAEP